METIGRIIATEKQPSTIEEFTFWTRKDLKFGRRNITHDRLAECLGGLYFQRFW